MTKTEKEFIIEFTLFEKRLRTTIFAETEDQATEKLFDAIRSKTKIEFIVKPKNEWNETMSQVDDLFNTFGRFSKPKLQ